MKVFEATRSLYPATVHTYDLNTDALARKVAQFAVGIEPPLFCLGWAQLSGGLMLKLNRWNSAVEVNVWCVGVESGEYSGRSG